MSLYFNDQSSRYNKINYINFKSFGLNLHLKLTYLYFSGCVKPNNWRPLSDPEGEFYLAPSSYKYLKWWALYTTVFWDKTAANLCPEQLNLVKNDYVMTAVVWNRYSFRIRFSVLSCGFWDLTFTGKYNLNNWQIHPSNDNFI